MEPIEDQKPRRKHPVRKQRASRTLASRFIRFSLEEAEKLGRFPYDMRLSYIQREFEVNFGGRVPGRPLAARLKYVYRRIVYGREAHYEDVVMSRVECWLALPENKELLAEVALT